MAIASAIGAAVGIGGAILGASAQKKAANKAADTSLKVARENNALAREMYGKNEGNLSPFMTRGNAAGDTMNALLGIGGDGAPGYESWARATAANDAFNDFRDSTGYKFRFDQGMNGLNALNAARGSLDSGAAVKSALQYGQNIGSQEFGNYLGYLSNQQGVGLSGASALAGVGQNYVNTISANNNSAGSAQANAALMAGRANANMFGGIAGSIGNALGSSFGGFNTSPGAGMNGATPGYGGPIVMGGAYNRFMGQ